MMKLRNYAEGLIRKYNIGVKHLGKEPENFGAQYLYEFASPIVGVHVQHFKPSVLGKIAAQGTGLKATDKEYVFEGVSKTTLYQVHCGTWLEKYWSGLSLLREIACTAIIAEMYDILSASINNPEAIKLAPLPRNP